MIIRFDAGVKLLGILIHREHSCVTTLASKQSTYGPDAAPGCVFGMTRPTMWTDGDEVVGGARVRWSTIGLLDVVVRCARRAQLGAPLAGGIARPKLRYVHDVDKSCLDLYTPLARRRPTPRYRIAAMQQSDTADSWQLPLDLWSFPTQSSEFGFEQDVTARYRSIIGQVCRHSRRLVDWID